jgi:hypothetical protein
MTSADISPPPGGGGIFQYIDPCYQEYKAYIFLQNWE